MEAADWDVKHQFKQTNFVSLLHAYRQHILVLSKFLGIICELWLLRGIVPYLNETKIKYQLTQLILKADLFLCFSSFVKASLLFMIMILVSIHSVRRYFTRYEVDDDRKSGTCTPDAICLHQEGVCLKR